MPNPPLPEHLQEILAKPNPAVMATLRPNGDPFTVATWYLWERGRVLLNLDGGRRRLEHLRRDRRVSLTVLDEAGWWRAISLRGRVASLEDDPELVDIDRISQHYEGAPYPNRARPRVSAWVEVASWHAWGL